MAEGKRKIRAGLIDSRGGNLNSGGGANPTRESGPNFWSLDVQGVWLIVLGAGIELLDLGGGAKSPGGGSRSNKQGMRTWLGYKLRL